MKTADIFHRQPFKRTAWESGKIPAHNARNLLFSSRIANLMGGNKDAPERRRNERRHGE